MQFPHTVHEICMEFLKKTTILNISDKIDVGLLNFVAILKPNLKGCGYYTLGYYVFN